MRGLKLNGKKTYNRWITSHLLQMRGLKPHSLRYLACGECRIFYRCVDWNRFNANGAIRRYVASFTDAWIETEICFITYSRFLVASFTDAWIETIGAGRRQKRAMSHLLQMRGLKLASGYDAKLRESRIFYRCVDWNPIYITLEGDTVRSHLLQMRGLKPLLNTFNTSSKQVASFTDAWIETPSAYTW